MTYYVSSLEYCEEVSGNTSGNIVAHVDAETIVVLAEQEDGDQVS